MTSLFERTRFVLVETSHPGNIGSVARAMKTMGFDAMRLVASRVHEEDEASWVAHGAQEILAQAEAFDTLPEALAEAMTGRVHFFMAPIANAVPSDKVQPVR